MKGTGYRRVFPYGRKVFIAVIYFHKDFLKLQLLWTYIHILLPKKFFWIQNLVHYNMFIFIKTKIPRRGQKIKNPAFPHWNLDSLWEWEGGIEGKNPKHFEAKLLSFPLAALSFVSSSDPEFRDSWSWYYSRAGLSTLEVLPYNKSGDHCTTSGSLVSLFHQPFSWAWHFLCPCGHLRTLSSVIFFLLCNERPRDAHCPLLQLLDATAW